MTRRKLLIVNGNTSATVTANLKVRAETVAPDADLTVRQPGFGPEYVSNPADVAVAGHGVMTAIEQGVAELGGKPDAVIIGCFGEPGLAAARHRWGMPIVGLAEASVLTALQLGQRYCVLTTGRHWPGMLWELFRTYGVDSRCAGIVKVEGDPLALSADPAAAVEAVRESASQALAQHRPDVLILGGVSLMGLAASIGPMPVPLVDCFDAGLAQAEALIAMVQRGMRISAET